MFGEGVGRTERALFLGAAMSITAFPMMARIIAEQWLSTSRIGTLLLAAGAIDHALAWCVLVMRFGVMGDSWWIGVLRGGGAFVVEVWLLLRPLMRWAAVGGGATVDWPVLARTLLLMLNFGLERGLISPTVFGVGVVMAVVTSLIATPLFDVLYRGERDAR